METSENSAKNFRHQLIQKEFRTILTSNEHKIPMETEGVVVLSGPAIWGENGTVESYDSPESRSRVEFGVLLVKEIAAKKSGKKPEEITPEEILEFAPPLVLNGVTEQLSTLKSIAMESGFPENKIQIVDSGKEGTASTKTQFEVMNVDPLYKDAKHLTFVTSSWHAPRVARTAKANLNTGITFDVIPAPGKNAPFDIIKTVRGEVKRIQTYSKRGDISNSATEKD